MVRPKGGVFSPYEKEVLLELIDKRKEVLENKINNAKILVLKEKAWTSLNEEFNSRHGVSERTEQQLKNLWRNLKARAKNDVAAARRSQLKTGGGADDVKFDTVTDKVCNILPQQIQSLPNDFDDDAEFHQDTQKDNNTISNKCHDAPTTSKQDNDRISVVAEVHPEPSPASSPAASLSLAAIPNNASLPQESTSSTAEKSLNTMIKSNPLFRSKSCSSKPSTTTGITLCKEKLLQMSELEHKRKLEIMEIEHKLKLEEFAFEKKRKNEIHEIKMEILKLKRQKLTEENGSATSKCMPAENSENMTGTCKIWTPY